MPTLLDLLYVALFPVALPLWDNLVFWPAFHRRSHADPARARMRRWAGSIAYAWALVAAGAVLRVANGRSWASIGLSVPGGWRLWASIALVVVLAVYHVYAAATVARSDEARASVRRQSGALGTLMPHTLVGAGRWRGWRCVSEPTARGAARSGEGRVLNAD